jgi:chromosome segregation ATPase
MKWSFYFSIGKNKGFRVIKEAMKRFHLGHITFASGSVDMEDLISGLMNKLDSLDKDIQDGKEFTKELENLKEEIASLNNRIEVGKKCLSEKEQIIEEKEQIIKNLEEKINDLKDEVLSLEVDLDEETEAKEKIIGNLENVLDYCNLK